MQKLSERLCYVATVQKYKQLVWFTTKIRRTVDEWTTGELIGGPNDKNYIPTGIPCMSRYNYINRPTLIHVYNWRPEDD